MGKYEQKEPRRLYWSYPDRTGSTIGHFMGTMNTTSMDRYFDTRYFEKKLYELYGCKKFEEVLKYLAKKTCMVEDDVPEDIAKDMVEEEIPEVREKLFEEIEKIRELCFKEYRWTAFEKKYTTPQQIYDQYTDSSQDTYDWYTSRTGTTKQVNAVFLGKYFTAYETYVGYLKYTSGYVTKFLVVVPTFC